MYAGTIAFFIGTLLIHLNTGQFSSSTVWITFLGSLVGTLITHYLSLTLLRLLAVGGLGFSWVLFYTHTLIAWELPEQWEAKDITVSGFIATIPEIDAYRQRFIFEIDKFQTERIKPIKTALSWYSPSPSLGVGDRWHLQVRLKRPHGFANPGSFDYERWLLQQRIRATGYVQNNESNQLIESRFLSYPIDRIRQKIADNLTKMSNNNQPMAIILALTLGLRNQLTPEQWRVFQKTGTSHLIAISGLHISLVGGLFYGLVSFFWRRSASLCLYRPAQQVAALGAIIAATLYAALAGFAIPTQRALIMIIVVMSCQILRTHTTLWQSLCLALLFVLIIDPLASLSVGFYLSFCAVALIFYSLGGRYRRRKWLWESLYTQWIVSIGLLPLGLLLFHQVSLISFIANLVAIPIIGLVCVPLCLVASLLLFIHPAMAQNTLNLLAVLLSWIWKWLNWLSTFPDALWVHVFPNFWIFITTFAAILLLLAPKGWPGRWLGLVWGLPLLYSPTQDRDLGSVSLTVLDVGQGLASVVRTSNHVLVFDTGAKFSPSLNAGDAVLVPYLRTLGVKQIDMLVVSHPHNDHKGGAKALVESFEVKQFYTTMPHVFPNTQALTCVEGKEWEWDEVRFQFLYPSVDDIGHLKDNESCVLKISAGEQAILIPGDIERHAENTLVDRQAEQLRANILVAPHHGSKTSSSIAFIDAVSPEYVVFSVGYLNPYRHPHLDVIERYDNFGAKWYDTVSSGSISFEISVNAELKEPEQYRLIHPHSWAKTNY